MRTLSRVAVGVSVVAVSVCAPFSYAHPAAHYLFPNPVYGVPGEDYDLVSGDFDGDGRPDVAVSNSYTTDVSAFFGDGRGGLRPEIRLGVPDGRLAAADFDRDGVDDLVVSVWRTNELVVVPGRRNGTFGVPVHLPVGTSPWGVVAADFDGNGTSDLAVANLGSDDVSVLIGRGDGSFEPQVRSAAGHRPGRLAAGGFDDDGRTDLAVIGSDPEAITVLLGEGDGRFTPGPSIVDGRYRRGIAAADVNGDRLDDLATADNYGASVFLNRGGGAFGPPQAYTPRQDLVFQAELVDLTADGKLDLVMTGDGGTVFPGNGDGTFGSRRSMGGGALAFGFAAADFDGDHMTDLATANGYRRSVTILRGNGDGTSGSRLAAGAFPIRIRQHDLNGDGRMDLIVLNEDSADVSIFLGVASGGFAPGNRVRVGSFYFPVLLADGDFDGDGHVDLAVGTFGVSRLALLYGRGDGTFDPPATLPIAKPVGWIEAGDVDRDGRADLVEVTGNGVVETQLSLGGGAFGPPILTTTNARGELRLVDLNADGALDIAQIDWLGSDAVVLLGAGDGTFDPMWRGGGDDLGGVIGLAVGDASGDRIPDLILLGDYGGFTVTPGAGDGTFGKSEAYWTQDPSLWAAVADFDLDGAADVAVSYGGHDVGIFVGRDGSLELQGRYDAGSGQAEAVVGDYNGDDRPDLAIVNADSNLVSILYNRANRAPVARSGADQLLECTGELRATAHLDGSASYDPDSTPGTDDDIASYLWSADGRDLAEGAAADVVVPLGPHDVTLTVTDKAAFEATDRTTITVRDTIAPHGSITFPAPEACYGPAALPVIVRDDFTDLCDPSVLRTYDPSPGPSFAEHGDHQVTVHAGDTSGNVARASVAFTIDAVAPRVVLVTPAGGTLLAPATLPLSVAFTAADDDGASGGVLREVVKLQGCVIFDGATYGDRDGLLSDEFVSLTRGELCRVAAQCGFTALVRPELRVEATDCGGNAGVASRTLAGSVSLRPGICGP